MNEQELNELKGSKRGNMSDEMRLVLETQKALLQCKTPGDVEIVFNTLEEKVGHGTSPVDRIGAMISAVLMLEAGQEAYNNTVDFFLAVAKAAREEK